MNRNKLNFKHNVVAFELLCASVVVLLVALPRKVVCMIVSFFVFLSRHTTAMTTLWKVEAN